LDNHITKLTQPEGNTMRTQKLSTVATEVIASTGNTAKNVIQAYRVGGERVVGLLEQRWDRAFKASRAQLSAETAKNAIFTQKMVSDYTNKGLVVTTNGAQGVVNQMVKLAGAGVERVAANASLFEEKTGVTALNTLAQATLPSVVVLSGFAAQMEQKSAVLARKVAGSNAVSATAKRAGAAVRKTRVAKAA
jgi:hypothetical protein